MNKLLYGIWLTLLASGITLADDVKSIEVDVLVKTTTSWDGSEFPEYEKGRPEVTILKVTIQPGAEFPLHKHPVINAGVIMKGELTVKTQDNKKVTLKAGDAAAELVNKWHYGKNEGNETVELIVFYAGIKGMPLTIKK